MFQGKNASNSEGKAIAKVKTITTSVNVINVNVGTRSKITKKTSFLGEITKEEQNYYRLGGGEVEEDNGGDNLVVAKAQATNEGSSTSIEGWNTMWPRMFNITPSIEPHKP